MRAAAQMRCLPDAYLAFERLSDEKHEYLAGEVFAMVGASREHNLIVTNIVAELRQQLKPRPCQVYANDMRVKVDASGLYTYPDVLVVCGEARFEDEQVDTLLNPTLIVEVLSETTEAYDRGEKFEHYRKLASLAEYLLVAQDRVHVEQFVRQPDSHWLLAEAHGRDAIVELPAVGAFLALAEIYDKLDL
jgi:Uma2 family endonuclease